MKTSKRVAATFLSVATAVSVLGTAVPVNAFAADDTQTQWSISNLLTLTKAQKMAMKNQILQLLDNGEATVGELQKVANELKTTYADKSVKEIARDLLKTDITDEIIKEGMTLEGILLTDIDMDELLPGSISTDAMNQVKGLVKAVQVFGSIYQIDDAEGQAKWREELASALKVVARGYITSIEAAIKEKQAQQKEEKSNSDSQSQSGSQSQTDSQSQTGQQSSETKQGSETTGTDQQAAKDTAAASSAKQTAISFRKSSAVLYVKGKVTIAPIIKNANGKTTYKSKNAKVAAVNANGKVTAKKKGTAKIAVTNNGVTANFTVTVKNPVLNASKKTLKKGKSFKLKVKKGRIGKVTFKSGNKKVATVNANGKVTAKKKGKAVITVTANGVNLKCKVTVK